MSRKTRVFLFFVIQALFYLGANFAHPVTPTLFHNLGLGNYMFGVALAAMMGVNFLVSPFWGKLNDYVSSKFTLLTCSIGYALGQYFFSVSTTEGQVIAARMFAGFFTAGAFVSVLTYVVNTNKDETRRGYYLAVSATIQSICSAFGYLIGGLLGEISVAAAFMTQVVTLSVCGILFFIVCENDSKLSMSGVKISTVIKESNPFSAFLASRHFMNLLLLILFCMVILQNLGNTAFDQSFNYFLKDQFNFSSGYNGAIKGAMGFITLIANSTVTVWIINRTDVRKSIIWVFLAGAVMMFIALISSQMPVPFIGANVIYYAFAAVSLPLLQNMVAKSAIGENSNIIMGFYNSMKSLGGIIGALVAGFLYNIAPLLPFIFGLLSYLSAFMLAIYYYRKRAPEQEID